jgi:hypothetical protein
MLPPFLLPLYQLDDGVINMVPKNKLIFSPQYDAYNYTKEE